MTTERLEELARKCEEALAPETPDIASILELADIADLARCARAWVKLEQLRNDQWSVSLDEWGDWALMTGYEVGGCPTAIEAVEAAEVGK